MLQKNITAIVLTRNEELHIKRCVENLKNVCSKIYVVDSFSTDSTCDIAQSCGAIVLQNKYINQAQQFQWALDNCHVETDWVMRLDADEYLTDELMSEFKEKLPIMSDDVYGVYLPRRVRFMDRTLRFGNLRPICLLRLWRRGAAYMEQRWMDEQMILNDGGSSVTFDNYFIDENLNGLTEWTSKHNIYSNREILTLLDNRYNLFAGDGSDGSLKLRNAQKSLYYRTPRFFRALAYFLLRYVCFLGFLDGIPGLIWLTLQSYWYRFLVDSKIYEMEKMLGSNPSRESIISYVRQYYNISVE